MKVALKLAVGALALSAAMPASAALVQVGAGCSATLPDPDAIACAGAYSGNLNSGARAGDLNAAIDILLGGNVIDVNFQAIEGTKEFFAGSGQTITFDNALFGNQIFSIHFGNAGSGLGDHTILYLFNFGSQGLLSVDLNQNGFSNAVYVTPPGVPEPATWAMMLMGFGVAGFALRRRRPALIKQVA